MSDVTIDTLRLDIVIDTSKATRNLGSFTKKLTDFSAVLNKVDVDRLNTLANAFSKIGNSLSGSGMTKSVNQVTKLNKKLQSTSQIVNKIDSGSATNKAVGRISSGFKLGSMIGKLVWFRNTTKQLGQSIANMVNDGIAFTETLNMWQVAMKNNTAEARTFIAEMNKAYGVSEQMLMQYQGTFKNMLSALGGIGDDSAYSLSKTLTNMALDFSSLYNVSIEDAMTKFQAVLSGQVRPIRSISGYDITENTIFDLYQQMGGQKSVRQLSQLEKRLLRIYAVFKQMQSTSALGDLQKTLTNNANQLRIMTSVAEEFAMWIGNAISFLMQESGILVKINALLIAGREIAKSWAYSLGYREENFASGLFEDVTDVNEGVDELQGKLLSFDKFNVLGDASAGTSDIDIEGMLLDAVSSYDSILSGAMNPAVEMANKILEKLGYSMVYYVGEGAETVKYTQEEFEALYGTIENANALGVTVREVRELNADMSSLGKNIAGVASALAGMAAVLSAIKLGTRIVEWAKSAETLEKLTGTVNLLKKAFSPLGIVIMAVVAALVYMYSTNEEFRASINKLLSALAKLLGDCLEPLGEILTTLVEVITPLLDVLAQVLTPIIEVAAAFFEWAAETGILSNTIKFLLPVIPLLITVINTLKTTAASTSLGIKDLNGNIMSMKNASTVAETGVKRTTAALTGMVTGLMMATSNTMNLINNWSDMSGMQRAAAILGVVAGVLFTVASAAAAANSAITVGIAAGAIVAGIAATAVAIAAASEEAKKVQNDISSSVGSYATGGGFNTADLFYAGEDGRTELVASSNNGRGGAVMNMQQLQEAVAAGVREAMGGSSRGYDNVQIVMDKTSVGKMVSRSSSDENSRIGLRR